MKRRFLAGAIALAVLLVMLNGCGGGLAMLLRITRVSALLPSEWTSNVGIVRIIADVLSFDSLREVIAHITDSHGSEVTVVVLTRNADGEYEGSFEAMAQETQPETLTAVVTATDVVGNQTTSEPVEVEIPAVSGTP